MAEDISTLIKKEDGYQDIYINGKCIHKGWRNCEDRWKKIKPYIAGSQVVMDVGSHYGYFSQKIAQEYDCVVWSVEGREQRAEIQRRVLEANKTENIALCQHQMKLEDFVHLARLSEGIDTIVMMSVVHYFPREHIAHILWLASKIAPRLIIEAPSPGESEVANSEMITGFKRFRGDIFERYLGLFYDKVAKIGEVPSPKDKKTKRFIFRAEMNKIKREKTLGSVGGELSRTHTIKWDKGWSIGKKEWIPGIGVWTTKYFNLIYPSYDYLIRGAAEKYRELMDKGIVPTDMRAWNCLMTPKGVEVIDYKEKVNIKNYDKIVGQYTVDQIEKEIKSMSK